MQTKLFLPLLLVSAVIFISGCNKDKDDKSLSRSDILTIGKWRMTALKMTPPVDYDGDGIVDSDVYAFIEACDKDDYFTFMKDGTLELNEGTLKCDPLDPQTQTDNWSFVNDEKEIIIAGDRCTILELNPTLFRVRVLILNKPAEASFTR